MKIKRSLRLKIYKRLLDCYVNDIQYTNPYWLDDASGMCYNLSRLLNEFKIPCSTEPTMNMFPELLKHKPIEFFAFNAPGESNMIKNEYLGFWWNNNADRIKVLEEIIHEMETTPWYKKLFQ